MPQVALSDQHDAEPQATAIPHALMRDQLQG